MRMLGLSLLVATGALAACAGPADPSVPPTAVAYRTGSLIKQPDVAQPTLTYYTGDQLARAPGQTLGRALAHSTPTPVPPAPEQSAQ